MADIRKAYKIFLENLTGIAHFGDSDIELGQSQVQ
jgi:hypothetical protein